MKAKSMLLGDTTHNEDDGDVLMFEGDEARKWVRNLKRRMTQNLRRRDELGLRADKQIAKLAKALDEADKALAIFKSLSQR